MVKYNNYTVVNLLVPLHSNFTDEVNKMENILPQSNENESGLWAKQHTNIQTHRARGKAIIDRVVWMMAKKIAWPLAILCAYSEIFTLALACVRVFARHAQCSVIHSPIHCNRVVVSHIQSVTRAHTVLQTRYAHFSSCSQCKILQFRTNYSRISQVVVCRSIKMEREVCGLKW